MRGRKTTIRRTIVASKNGKTYKEGDQASPRFTVLTIYFFIYLKNK